MDRNISYAGQVPRALDFLRTGEFAMVGLAKIAEAMLGTSTVVSQGGFAVTPGSGLNISVGPGQIYQLQSIEPTSLSALNVDGHQVLKQGVALDGQTLTLAPPATVGYAQNFLVQAAYADVPDGSIVLSYQNPTPVLDPNTGALKYVTYPGPGGNGAAQYTILRGAVSLNAKPGVAAPAGQQTTPAPDVGYVGLYVVTLAYGATSISSGSIAPYANAPFIPITLPQVPAAIQAQAGNGAPDTGTANAIVLALPAYTPGALPDYTPIRFKKGPNPNTGPTTIAINGTTYAVQTFAGAALTGGELPGNSSLHGIVLGGVLRLGGGLGSAGPASGGVIGTLPIFPEITTGGGAFTFTSGSGSVTIAAVQTWIWRLNSAFSTSSFAGPALAFATAASKIYHLVWDAPGTGLATPATSYPNGLFSLLDRTGASPVETDASYDTTFDRMLVARVVTDSSNNVTVTPLKNKAQLRATTKQTGTATQFDPTGNAYIAPFTFTYNYARTPDVIHRGTVEAVLVGNGGYVERGANDEKEGDTTITRYAIATTYYTDWNTGAQPSSLLSRFYATAIA